MIKDRMIKNRLDRYRLYLLKEEKSQLTVEKYIRDVNAFYIFLSGKRLNKHHVISFKKYLIENYKATSANSMIAAVNNYLKWMGLQTHTIKPIKIQRQIFRSQEKNLTRNDYNKLLHASKQLNNEQINLIMQTICATGIRVSELSFITVESLKEGYVQVNCKNKTRLIWMPVTLQKKLRIYIKKLGISKGTIFITPQHRPVSRVMIWSNMKKAARIAGIDVQKVYPHNLRHLFARSFYEMDKDIVKLSDILGHSNIETTRIYTMTTGKEYAGYLERLNFVSKIT